MISHHTIRQAYYHGRTFEHFVAGLPKGTEAPMEWWIAHFRVNRLVIPAMRAIMRLPVSPDA